MLDDEFVFVACPSCLYMYMSTVFPPSPPPPPPPPLSCAPINRSGILRLKKLSLNLCFGLGYLISTTKQQQLLHLFNFYLLSQKIWGSGYGPEIHFVLSHYQPFVFHKNTMVNPSIKGRKSKNVHQNQNQNFLIRGSADAERTISLFVLIGLVPFSFIWRTRLIGHCFWPLRLAKPRVNRTCNLTGMGLKGRCGPWA